jgi:hypothetical protein
VTTETRSRPALVALLAERDFLLASLADLEREHAAGDVAEADFSALRSRYVTRAAEALREIERLETDDARPKGLIAVRPPGFRQFLGERRVRRSLMAIGCICVAGIALLVAAKLAGVRLPGESATGTVNVPSQVLVREELAQASVLGSERQVSPAVALYDTVLQQVPNQPEALTYRGWLIRLAGLQAHSAATVRTGDASLAHAVAVAPGYADGRALYGVALLEDAHASGRALQQFRAFAADRPSNSLLAAVGPKAAAAFVASHAKLPTALAPYAR